MAGTLSIISLAAYILAGLFLVAAIVLFIALKIPAVINELTNRSAHRAIRMNREKNEQGGKKAFVPEEFMESRPHMTSPIPKAAPTADEADTEAPLIARDPEQVFLDATLPPKTDGLEEQVPAGTMALGPDGGTMPLGSGNGTMPLGAANGMMPLGDGNGTMPLGTAGGTVPLGDAAGTMPLGEAAPADGTAILTTGPATGELIPETAPAQPAAAAQPKRLEVRLLKEIVCIHTQEVIG